MWIIGWNVWFINYTLARNTSSFMSPQPRLRGAFTLALLLGWVRINIAATIGAAGYFYSYEYLYTHGPPGFRIRDPTPNGWKLAWQDGQECYLARAAASVFPALGYAFFMGRWKKSAFWFLMTVAAGEYYEYARRNVMSGTRLFYSYQANKELQRQAAWGSLAPDLRHRVDPDTNRSASVAQFRYLRLTSGPLQDTIWNNIPHENLPLHRTGKMVPNPYFNWQKAPQNYNDKPYKVKNDLWQLPQVLDSRMRSGAMD
ncbi:hypothetical protein STCU_01481 [Strigomonas culicis]|nr:hypothetical protein STCU_01481 [Strigomonas culicis]|eukprot:EPY34621.1 hypothetical protein STCU_01481 [Strigomonas culicis]